MKNTFTIFILVILLLLSILLSCTNSDNNTTCDNTMKRVYVETSANNFGGTMITYYKHYILLSKYSDVCFDAINFSQVAKQYVDTCTFKKPVRIITFLKSLEETDSDAFIPTRIMKHELIEFRMDSTRIKSIHIVKDGSKKEFTLNNCELIEK